MTAIGSPHGGRVLYLVPAGGSGSRLMPHTRSLPKPLFPMDGKRLVDFALDEVRGAFHTVVTVRRGMAQVGKYVRAAYRDVSVLEETEALGTAGALRMPLLRDMVDAVDVVLVAPADHVSSGLARLDAASALLASGLPAGQILVGPAVRYGDSVALDRHGRIAAVSSDPCEHRYSSTGIFAFSSAYLRAWWKSDRGGHSKVDFYRDLFMPLCGDGRCLGVTTVPDYWDDVGTPERYWLNAMLRSGGRSVYSADEPRDDRSRLTRCVVIGRGKLPDRSLRDAIISWSSKGAPQVTQLAATATPA